MLWWFARAFLQFCATLHRFNLAALLAFTQATYDMPVKKRK